MKNISAATEPTAEVDALASAVVDAALEVHRALGPGLLERPYAEALAHELKLRGVPYAREVPIELYYKGTSVGACRLDFVVGGSVIVELKAVEALLGIHRAQVLSYLRASGLPLGLLVNFNVPLLKDGLRRIALTKRRALQ